ncbi:tyrosine-type recombinase/integrase [Deinococcus phoenicis]|uniref:tyrosine-type recombinase/integrase n=1 Tax=Deinococcus phoenicis TaxID=1476583 RepID=UPI001378D58C|nr:site-specific integrase [Deinococcus phoenicis]
MKVDLGKGKGAWELRFTARPPGQPSKVVSRMFTGTEAQARTRLRELIAEFNRVGVTDATSNFTEFVRAWEGQLAVSEGARRRYSGVVRRNVIPRWEGVKLRNVTLQAVRGWYADLGETYSRATIRQIHTAMRGALNLAVQDGLIPYNPLLNMTINATKADRSRKPREVKAFSEEQASAFLKASLADRGGGPLAFALLTGARIGEVLALRWDSVDLDKGLVSIKATRSAGDSGGVYESAPKSRSGVRTLRVSGAALDLLRSQAQRAEEEHAARLPGWVGKPQYVFFTLRGTPYRPDAVKRYRDRICDAASVPRLNVHGLRHSAASILLSQGRDLAAVSKHLGHSRISVTLDTYRHVLPHELEDLTLKLD